MPDRTEIIGKQLMVREFRRVRPSPCPVVLSRDISQPSSSHISSHIHWVAVGHVVAPTLAKSPPGNVAAVVVLSSPYLPFSFRSSYGAENA